MTFLHKKIIIFDFDGTIANTIPLGLSVINELSDQFGFRKIEERELSILRGKTPTEIIKEFNIPLYKIPFISFQVQKKFKQRLDEIRIFPEMADVLRELKKRKYNLAILTSNSQENVDHFLRKNDLFELFDFIHGEKNLFGKHIAFKKLIKNHMLSIDEVLYIGDEVRDVEACKKVGVDIVSVTWGFNTRTLLEKYNSSLIDTPTALLDIIA